MIPGSPELFGCEPWQIFQAGEPNLATLQTDGSGSRGGLACLRDQKVDAACRQTDSLDAVKGGGVSPLLHVTEYRLTHIKELAAFLLKEGAHEIGRVQRIGVLVSDHEPQALAKFKGLDEVVHIRLEVSQGQALCGKIDPVGT